jgi:hypothetical protein
MKKPMPPWIKANNGRLSIDTDHPEWIAYFKAFVTDPKRLEQSRRFVNKKTNLSQK